MATDFDEEDEARERKRTGTHYTYALVVGTIALTTYTESVLIGTVCVASGAALLAIVNSFHARLAIISQRLKSIDIKLSEIGAVKEQ